MIFKGIRRVSFGICAEAQRDLIIRGNEVANVTSISTGGTGYIGDDDAIGIFTFNVSGYCLIEKNKIHDIRHNGGAAVRRSAIGIYLDGEAIIRNNMIWNLSHAYAGASVQSITGGVSNGTNFNPGYGVFGIIMRDAATGGWVKTVHNDILINTNTLLSSTCIYVGRGTDTLRNNICVNSTAAQTTAKHFGIFLAGAATPSIDYDVIYTLNTNGFVADTSSVNGNTLTDVSWATWQSKNHDVNGYNADPLFVGTTNLHIQSTSAAPGSNSAQPGWATDDIDGETRTSTPDIGADEGSFAAALSAPASVTFGTLTSTSIVVNWSAVSGATGYRVESSTDGTNFTLLSSPVSLTTYTDATITSGNSRRYYRVYSINTDNVLSISPSPINNTYSLANTPAAPVAEDYTSYLVHIIPQNSVSPANWTETEYAIRVDLLYIQADGSLGASAVWQTLSNWSTKIVSNLTANTLYSITTRARNGNGTLTDWSTATTFTTYSTPPSTLSFGTITTTSIEIEWSAVAGCTYRLEYSNDDENFFLMKDSIATTSYIDTNFTKGNSERDYRVFTRNSAGELSVPGAWYHTTTLVNVPVSPTVSNPTSSSFQITPLNATSPVNTDSTQYAIKVDTLYVHSDGSLGTVPFWQTLTCWGTVTVSGFNPSTTYSVSTVGRTEFGVVGSYSSIAQIVTLALALPPAPQNATIDDKYSSSLRVNWSAPASPGNMVSYEIQVSTTGATSGFTVLATDLPLTPTSFEHTSLNSYTPYWYRIYSKNSQGAYSGTYASVSDTTTANWHMSTSVAGGNGDTTAWTPQFPADSLTYFQPALSINFAAVPGPSTNPTGLTFRWDYRAEVISSWGLNGVELNASVPSNRYVNRIWEINSTGGSGFDATVYLRFNTADLPPSLVGRIGYIDQAAVKHGTGLWACVPCTVTGPDGDGIYTAVVDHVNQFSYWAIGSSSSLLPVTLQSFTASNDNLGVVLNWRTETEFNIDHYRIDRWKEDGEVERQYVVPSLSEYGMSATPLEYIWHEPEQLVEGKIYTYQLVEMDLDGTERILANSAVTILPSGINLIDAYPNPFNSTIRISVSLKFLEKANVTLYNIRGQKVADLYTGEIGRFKRSISFHATALSSGVYFVRVQSSHFQGNKKVVLVK